MRTWSWMLVLSGLLVLSISSGATEKREKVLLITSYHLSHQWSLHSYDALARELNREEADYELDLLELNTIRENIGDTEKVFATYLPRIAAGEFKMIVGILSDATALLTKHADSIPEKTALVVCSYENGVEALREKHPNTTGVAVAFPVLENIQLGLQLMPDTEEIAVVIDDTPFGEQIFRKLTAELETLNLPCRVSLISGKEYNTRQMLKRVSELPEKSFVIFLPWRNYARDGFVSLEAVGRELDARSRRPYMILTESLLQNGALGGMLTSSGENAKALADSVRGVLQNNGKAVNVPLRTLTGKIAIDMKEMVDHNLDRGKLPTGVMFLNYTPTLWEAYGAELLWITGGILLLVLLLTSVGVVFWRYFRLTRQTMAIFDALPLRISVVDEKGRFRFQQMEEACRDQMKNFRSIHDGGNADAEFIHAGIAATRQSAEPVTITYDSENKKRLVTFRRFKPGIFGRNAVMWVSQDVSELANERERSAIMAEQRRIVLHSIGDGLIATDAQERITVINPVAASLMGVSCEEAIGKPLNQLFKIVSYLDEKTVASPVTHALTSGKVVELTNHTDLISATGSRRHIADSAAPMFDEKGAIIGAVLVFRDVTQEYDQRDQLRASLQLLRYASRQARMTYFHWDLSTGKQTSEVGEIGDNWGRDENGEALPPEKWIYHEDLAEFKSLWEKLISGECREIELNYRSDHHGEMRYFILFASEPDCNDGGTPGQIFGVIQDVTHVNENERKYTDSESLLRALIDVLPTPILVKDATNDWRYVLANRCFCDLVGVMPSEIGGKSDFDLFGDSDLARKYRKDDINVVENGGVVNITEEIHDQQGDVHYLHTLKGISKKSDGRTLLIGVGIDVTQLEMAKRSEEEARLVLQALLDHLPAAICAKDAGDDFRYVIWNKELEKHSGFAAEDVIGRTDFEISPYPGSEQTFRDLDVRVLAGEEMFGIPEVCISATGRKITYRTYKTSVRTPFGKTLLIDLCIDSTREIKLEQEREEMIESLNNHIRNEQILNHCLQRITVESDFAAAVNELLSVVGRTLKADRSYIFRYHDSLEFADNLYEWVGDGVAPHIDDLQNVRMAGMGIWTPVLRRKDLIEVSDTENIPEALAGIGPLMDLQKIRSLLVVGIWEDGKLWGFFGIDFVNSSHCFTESDRRMMRNAANLLLLARERNRQMNEIADATYLQRQIFDNIAIPIVMFDEDYNVVTGNPAAQQVCGKTLEELRNSKCYRFLCGGDAPPNWCPVEAIRKDHLPKVLDYSGHNRNYRLHVQPIFDRYGKMVYILESAIDITDFCEQQRELEIHNRLLHRAAEMALVNNFGVNVTEILRLLGGQLNCRFCCFGIYKQNGAFFEIPFIWRSENIDGLTDESIKSGAKHFIRRDEELEKNDIVQFDSATDGLLKEWFDATTAGSVLCVPVRIGAYCCGVLALGFGDDGHAASEGELHIISAAGKIISLARQQEMQREELATSLKERQIIYRNIQVPIMLFDTDCKLVSINPAAVEMTGKSEEEVLSSPCYNHFCEQPCRPEFCPVKEVLKSGKETATELKIHGRDYIMRAEPIFNSDGEIINVIENAMDITEINRSKQQLEAMMTAAQAADRAKSFFLATMSHELRTPLNAVIGFSELLQFGDVPPEEQAEYLKSINFAGTALLNLINDVLDLSKIEAEQIQLIPIKTDIAVLLEEICSIFKQKIEQKNLTLQARYIPNLPQFYLDSLRLRQVLLNLIGNATKFTSEGGITIGVRFEPEDAEHGTLYIGVTDTGIGIAEEFISRIFTPFAQEDAVRGNRTSEGSGLGLAISQRLIAKMGGELSVQSAINQGSTFTIRLNHIRYVALPVEPVSAPEPTEPERRKPRILVVDDVPMNLKVLSSILKKLQCEAVPVNSGRDALTMIENERFDLLLTDLWMPEMNGSELAAAVRGLANGKELRIIAVTADTECKENFDLSNFETVIKKPIEIKLLQSLIFEDAAVESKG